MTKEEIVLDNNKVGLPVIEEIGDDLFDEKLRQVVNDYVEENGIDCSVDDVEHICWDIRSYIVRV